MPPLRNDGLLDVDLPRLVAGRPQPPARPPDRDPSRSAVRGGNHQGTHGAPQHHHQVRRTYGGAPHPPPPGDDLGRIDPVPTAPANATSTSGAAPRDGIRVRGVVPVAGGRGAHHHRQRPDVRKRLSRFAPDGPDQSCLASRGRRLSRLLFRLHLRDGGPNGAEEADQVPSEIRNTSRGERHLGGGPTTAFVRGGSWYGNGGEGSVWILC
mmetsp:Transcript_29359/g.60032  ORF Transcript_29359/g.60032 Transcript_29359/m.60032 type:complete len:210 (-) Transcript_29359:195-824(-)